MYTYLVDLPRPIKRSMMLLLDIALVPIGIYLAFALRLETTTPFQYAKESWVLLPMTAFCSVLIIHFFRLPQIKLHAFDTQSVARIGTCAATLAVTAVVISYIFQIFTPRSVPIIFGAVFFIFSVLIRVFIVFLLGLLQAKSGNSVRVAVYGAGSAGIQLVSALRQSQDVQPVIFVDDNPALQGLIVAGLRVEKPNRLLEMANSGRIQRVLLALPSASAVRQNALVARLSELGCEVQILPTYAELMAGKDLSSSLRTVEPDELLGRDKVELDNPDVARAYAGRIVMVTGAGGSIGSELCRQLLNCRPATIVLFDQSELAIYEVDQDLRPLAELAGVKVVTRLGSVTNNVRIEKVLLDEQVGIVLHAAAYKHVPIVEENELEGAQNNVLGTQIVAQAAQRAGVERMILVSTDKAVRPTNVMGATKRMAELVIQDLQTRSSETNFSMVRFGNVLGSSGSVLPLFQRQIAAGGPVTITHPDVTRYFMTIPEAARLVLLAGAYAQGGDVFVLDMGKPMKIMDIARRMIEMSGRSVKEKATPEGDIELIVTGLRPGEKLYEELLIDHKSLQTTPHEKILRAKENKLTKSEVATMIKGLNASITSGDKEMLRNLISKTVDGYHVQKIEEPVNQLGPKL